VVALLQRRHPVADVDHHARPLVPEDHREEPLGIGTRARELVGVADARRLQLDQHLASLRAVELDLLDDQRLPYLVRYRCVCPH
jgi:hypothetical protein